MVTEIDFKLMLFGKDRIRVCEANQPVAIEFSASSILHSEEVLTLVGHAFANRIKEIVAEHLKRLPKS